MKNSVIILTLILFAIVAIAANSPFQPHEEQRFQSVEAVTGDTPLNSSPVNYTPTSADTSGHLNGIDTALGSSGQVEFGTDVFRLFNNDSFDDKKIAFDAAGISAATTRTITMPDADVDLADIATNTSNISGKADTNLGNLSSPTAFNQDLLPVADNAYGIGSSSAALSSMSSRFFNVIEPGANLLVARVSGNSTDTTPSGNSVAVSFFSLPFESTDNDFGIWTDISSAANAVSTGDIYIETGNKTAGTGDSGKMSFKTGTSVGGARGVYEVDALNLQNLSGGIIPVKVTADPCGDASAFPEGSMFYNDTSNYYCYCDGTNDVQMHSPATACF